jgi:hypothetical protein
MSIESPEDWAGLREAGRVTRRTLDALEAHVRDGVTTGELDAVAASVFAAEGARSAPALVYGFPGTVLISVNDEVVHGVPGRRQFKQAISSSSTSPSRRTATSPTRRGRSSSGPARSTRIAWPPAPRPRSTRRCASRVPACSSTKSAGL